MDQARQCNSCFTFGHTDIIINTNVDDDKAQDLSFQYVSEEEYQRQGDCIIQPSLNGACLI